MQYLFVIAIPKTRPFCLSGKQPICSAPTACWAISEWSRVKPGLKIKSFPKEKKQIDIINGFMAECNKENEAKVHGSEVNWFTQGQRAW